MKAFNNEKEEWKKMSTVKKLDQNQTSDSGDVVGSNIGLTERFGYGLGDFAGNIVFSAIGMFLTFYYTDIIGISAGIIGTIMMLSRFFDGATDIGMGIITDKTRSKHGKARPWILWMAIPFAISTILLFSVPESWNLTAQIVFIVITYNLVNLIFTAINVPYGVMNSLITQDQYQRSILNIFRMTLATLCTLMLSYIVLPISDLFGGGARGWQMTFVLLGVVSVILFYITFKTTKERVKPAQSADHKKVPVKVGLKALFKNKYWAILVLFLISVYTLLAVMTGVNIYYAQYILGDPNLVGTLTAALTIPQLVGLFLIAPIIKRFGKRDSVIAGLLLMVAGSILIALNPDSITMVIIGTGLRGLGAAPLAGSMFAMLADTIEYGEWKSGVRTEGLVYSAGSFGTKVGGGIGVAIMGWILSFGGYISGADGAQPDSALVAIEFLFVYLPIIFMAILVLLLAFYKLDKLYPQIMKDLKTRNT